MTSEQLRHLQARRARLVTLAARQRVDVANALRAWAEPLVLIDRGIAVWHFLKARPLLLAAGLVLVVMLRRRHAMTWLSGAVAAWRLYRTMRLRLASR